MLLCICGSICKGYKLKGVSTYKKLPKRSEFLLEKNDLA